MKRFNYLLLILISLFAFSCNTKTTSEPAESHDEHAKHETVISNADILLDNGEKWKANIETTEGIKTMQNICSHYSGNVADVENTYLSLLSEFNMIFEKCTMTGDAHEQLHAFLIPVKNQLAVLKDCKSDCDKEVKFLNEYLATYYTYFE